MTTEAKIATGNINIKYDNAVNALTPTATHETGCTLYFRDIVVIIAIRNDTAKPAMETNVVSKVKIKEVISLHSLSDPIMHHTRNPIIGSVSIAGINERIDSFFPSFL